MLLKYESEKFQALNSPGWGYQLTMRISDWWGLRKYTKTFTVRVPYHLNADDVYGKLLNKWVTPKEAKRLVNQRSK